MSDEIINVDDDLLKQKAEGDGTGKNEGGGEGDGGDAGAATKPDELKIAMAELAKSQKELLEKSKAPEPKEKELTQEQQDELWAVYNPEKGRADFMKKFFKLNPEATDDEVKEARAMWGDMQKGLVKQAVTGARNLWKLDIDDIKEMLKPLQEYISNEKATKLRDKFYKSYESLNDPKFSKIIDAQARLLGEKDFATEDEYFKALAEGAADTIKGVLPEFELGAGKPTKTTATTPKLNRSSAGGGGGAGKGAQAQATESKDAAGSVLD